MKQLQAALLTATLIVTPSSLVIAQSPAQSAPQTPAQTSAAPESHPADQPTAQNITIAEGTAARLSLQSQLSSKLSGSRR